MNKKAEYKPRAHYGSICYELEQVIIKFGVSATCEYFYGNDSCPEAISLKKHLRGEDETSNP